jgi:hypothetical protein
MFRAMSRIQWHRMLTKLMPSAPKRRATPTKRGERQFRFAIGGSEVTVEAKTRSEARAILKRDFGKLPVGCSIRSPRREAA